jgi:hypothetical protein
MDCTAGFAGLGDFDNRMRSCEGISGMVWILVAVVQAGMRKVWRMGAFTGILLWQYGK